MVCTCKALLYYGLPTAIVLYLLYKRISRRLHRSVRGQTVLITGACHAEGLGFALAEACISRGASKVLLTGRSESDFAPIVERLKAHPACSADTEILPYKLDLTWPEDQIIATVSKMWSECGGVHVVFNNAGCSYRGEVMNTQTSVYRRLMETNFLGPVALSQCLLSLHHDSHAPLTLVGISSIQGMVALPFRSAYAASKHAFHAYHQSLRWECARDTADGAVSVVLVHPAYMRTRLSLNAVRGDTGAAHGTMDRTTEKGLEPQVAAEMILTGVESGDEEVWVSGLLPRLAVFLNTLGPPLYAFVMKRKARTEKPF